MSIKTIVLAISAVTLITACGGQESSHLNNSPNGSITVNGPKAKAIMTALEVANPAKSRISGGYRISVSDLKCDHTPQGFVFAQCQFRDSDALTKSNRKLSLLTQKALNLMNALSDAGVPAAEIEDPMTKKAIAVTSIVCRSGGYAAGHHCVIEL